MLQRWFNLRSSYSWCVVLMQSFCTVEPLLFWEKFVNSQCINLPCLDIRQLACFPSLRRNPGNIQGSFKLGLMGSFDVKLAKIYMKCSLSYPNLPLLEASYQHLCPGPKARPLQAFFCFSPSPLKGILGHFWALPDSSRVSKSQVLGPSW